MLLQWTHKWEECKKVSVNIFIADMEKVLVIE